MLVAALFAQTAALLLFIGTHIWMSICLSGEHANLDLKFAPVYQSAKFRRFLFGMPDSLLHRLRDCAHSANSLADSRSIVAWSQHLQSGRVDGWDSRSHLST